MHILFWFLFWEIHSVVNDIDMQYDTRIRIEKTNHECLIAKIIVKMGSCVAIDSEVMKETFLRCLNPIFKEYIIRLISWFLGDGICVQRALHVYSS